METCVEPSAAVEGAVETGIARVVIGRQVAGVGGLGVVARGPPAGRATGHLRHLPRKNATTDGDAENETKLGRDRLTATVSRGVQRRSQSLRAAGQAASKAPIFRLIIGTVSAVEDPR